jgi:hypothetical protein
MERHFALRLLAEVDFCFGEQAVHQCVLVFQLYAIVCVCVVYAGVQKYEQSGW